MNVSDFQRRQERIIGLRQHARDWQQRSYGYPVYKAQLPIKSAKQVRWLDDVLSVLGILLIGVAVLYL